MSIGDDEQIPEQSGATPPEDGPGTPTDLTDSIEGQQSASAEPSAPHPNSSEVD